MRLSDVVLLFHYSIYKLIQPSTFSIKEHTREKLLKFNIKWCEFLKGIKGEQDAGLLYIRKRYNMRSIHFTIIL